MSRLPTIKIGPVELNRRNGDASTNELATAISASEWLNPHRMEVRETPRSCANCGNPGITYQVWDHRDEECGIAKHGPYWSCDDCGCQMRDCTRED